MSKCSICNTWNTDSAKFCRNCGKSLVPPIVHDPINPLSSRHYNPPTSSASNTSSLKQNESTKSHLDDNPSPSGMSEGTKWFFTVLLIIVGIALIAGGYSAPIAAACAYTIKKIWD